MTMGSLPTIAMTMGDPAGVGPEICLRVLGADRPGVDHAPLLFGDMCVLDRVSKASGIAIPAGVEVVSLEKWQSGYAPQSPCIVDMQAIDPANVEPGALSADCGAAAHRYILCAIEAAKAGRVNAVVTAPINKEALRAAGVQHPGHTEIFAEATGCASYCMMLTSPELSVSFVTTHRSILSVSESLNADRVHQVIALTADAMTRLTGQERPKICVLGLNPHAGEHGLFGGEESSKIEPAIARAAGEGIDVTGPIPPDTAFTDRSRETYAAFVCMYHDQGHIPFKMLAFDTGVNTTLGLPIVRTSVDHGTAFDIAWQGKASPTSMAQAIIYAIKLASDRG